VNRPVAYGIDLGTTNSSVAALVDGRAVVLQVDSGGDPPEALRSIDFLHRDGDRDAGREAARKYLQTALASHRCNRCDRVKWLPDGPFTSCRQFAPGGGCKDARLVSGIKPLLTDDSFRETSSWGEVFDAEELASVVLWRLKREADERFGVEVDRVVLGYPVHFETIPTGDLAFERLRGAAERASFRHVDFCPEPLAAVWSDNASLKGRTVCSVDFGGGTFDVVVVRYDEDGDPEPELLGLSGVPVGGELFDRLLFDRYVEPILGLDHHYRLKDGRRVQLPAYIRQGFRSLEGVTRLAAAPSVFTTLRQIQAEAEEPRLLEPLLDLLYGGQAFDFWSAIEHAKKDLSTAESSHLGFRREHLDVSVRMSRVEFERLIAPHLRRVRASIKETLAMAQLHPREVDVVIRTGGSALLPAFNVMLDELFGAARVEAKPAFSSVAAGLAELAATTNWRALGE